MDLATLIFWIIAVILVGSALMVVGLHNIVHSAIALVLVSPNMTYPKALKAAAQKVVDAAPARIAKLELDVGAAADSADKTKIERLERRI